MVDPVRAKRINATFTCSRPNVDRNFPIHMMTPTWVFPAYPLLLTGPFAAHLIDSADVAGHPLSINKTAIALCATATQGTGCLIAFMISAAFIYRLMTQKLPRDMQRPGVVRLFLVMQKICPTIAPSRLTALVYLCWTICIHGLWNRYAHAALLIYVCVY